MVPTLTCNTFQNNVENGQDTLKILRYEHRKIFRVKHTLLTLQLWWPFVNTIYGRFDELITD